ncbi:MAG TPA: M50 family metallopeptidase [Candidatus Paceibacterota bacterium]|nr:M50 family metallopeptidase [Candidatus Paceibacterota bacterium]
MEILTFLIVIVALILVHELGHFIAAKLSGMRVDEFGIGFPPRAATIATIGETSYTLNWLPFGGFVKIYGEDGVETGPRSFSSRSRIKQAIVLVAGVAMNLLFAYVLITGALVAGTPRALTPNEVAQASDTSLAVVNVLPNTPAALAGIALGDSVTDARDANGTWHAVDPAGFSSFIAGSGGAAVTLHVVDAEGVERTITATPVRGLVADDPSRYALGIEVATIGVVPVSLPHAITQGAALTWGATMLTAAGLWHLFYGIFTLSANLSQVSGPVGIAGAVGAASAQGFGDLLSLMAVISINLAIINLIPIPALDGGRLLFVVIEGIIRRPIKPSVARAVNLTGFAFLILLMVVVTAHDIFRIVG